MAGLNAVRGREDDGLTCPQRWKQWYYPHSYRLQQGCNEYSGRAVCRVCDVPLNAHEALSMHLHSKGHKKNMWNYWEGVVDRLPPYCPETWDWLPLDDDARNADPEEPWAAGQLAPDDVDFHKLIVPVTGADGPMLRCIACSVTFPEEGRKAHCALAAHKVRSQSARTLSPDFDPEVLCKVADSGCEWDASTVGHINCLVCERDPFHSAGFLAHVASKIHLKSFPQWEYLNRVRPGNRTLYLRACEFIDEHMEADEEGDPTTIRCLKCNETLEFGTQAFCSHVSTRSHKDAIEGRSSGPRRDRGSVTICRSSSSEDDFLRNLVRSGRSGPPRPAPDVDESKTPIVIDGLNVGFSYGSQLNGKDAPKQWLMDGVKQAVEFYQKQKRRVTVWLPQYYAANDRHLTTQADRQLMDDLHQDGVLMYMPNHGGCKEDDVEILGDAVDNDGCVVSNDMFRDHIEHSKDQDGLREWVDEHVIPYMWRKEVGTSNNWLFQPARQFSFPERQSNLEWSRFEKQKNRSSPRAEL